MWLIALAPALAGQPEGAALADTIAAISRDASIELFTCALPGRPAGRWLALEYRDLEVGTWACTQTDEGVACGPAASSSCRDIARATPRPGALPPELGAEDLSSLMGPALTGWLEPGAEVVEVRLPPLDLSALFGREAWGVALASGRALAPGQPAELTYTLLALAQGPDGLLEAGRVSLGEERYGRPSLASEDWFEERSLRCPVARGRELLLYRSCSPAAAPRRPTGEPTEYEDLCDPLCYSGRGALQRLSVEGDRLLDRSSATP